ncbi:P-loop containing nucleoside triphosphate hydrolase protein [Dactylonectria estremocensis]|uniref:P-loop containing nucleoside triphosphate hydrolase protein n=1 Tax=Dactylonectria estremocensis TaxID=1079267 RepID=A0A9P9E3C0_9HYPO|nr:P-loop containing nucleoside triphosphate hydrolase protein [Dactylonectria estremocensis]
MDASRKSSHNLFEVYLRLRPPPHGNAIPERILEVEEPETESHATHITLNPPTDRRRAIEKFAFTQVFEEDASQLDVFNSLKIASLVEGVLAPQGGEGTDAVVATLGVTGSGKTHTILGSKSQRGLTQLAMDVVFQSIGDNMLDSHALYAAQDSLQACDASESPLTTAAQFFDAGEHTTASRAGSRAATPMIGDYSVLSPPRRQLQRTSALPQMPDVSGVNVSCDPSAEYAVVISMYEVHNDRIYDLLTPPSKSGATKELRRRPLLFKSTELSPDRKVVAGLRKVVCSTYSEALMVVETGLQERRVTGTGSNSVSSRSHGFFCFEVKKRARSRRNVPWEGNRFTIVDLAGSERARDAKTQGATLAEAGKINESLMYLGQCLQTQSEVGTSAKPNIVPYRQCKLTELLFSNSFPSASATANPHSPRRNPQKGVMVVTADPRGDFNATSQILRYSALAREVTVPRIPSVAKTILAHPPVMANNRSPSPSHHHPRPFAPAGSGSYRNYTPPMSSDERATMEIAALEIARLSDEIDQLRAEVDIQTEARTTAEAHLLTIEDKMLDLEMAIRDDCAIEFEQRLALELARFKASMALEQERNEEHWDRKVEVLERGLATADDDGDYDKENVLIEDLEDEVERLRRENGILKRELASRSPTKRRPLEERDDFAPPSGHKAVASAEGVSNLGRKLERMRVSGESVRATSGASTGSPKKMRKLGTRRWEDQEDHE